MRRVHPLTYPVARKARERAPKLFARRDGSASSELLYPLYELGFAQGEPILQQPPGVPPREPVPFEKLHEVDLSFVEPGALLLQTTRPPKNDTDEGPRRQIERAYTDLEHLLFEAIEPYVEYISRTHLCVGPRVRDLVPQGCLDRREMSFRQKGWGAPYHRLNALDGKGWHKYAGPPRTALFLLRLDEIWPGGPGCLCAWGQDGCTTLCWCYRLARDPQLKRLLAQPGFVMAELELGELPERATDLRFCLDWKIEILVQHELRSAPPPRPKPAPSRAGLVLA
jgi:hypothetical protein